MSGATDLVIAADLESAATWVQHYGELIGTVAFAASGALAAVRRNLDIVGIVVLASATALGGGIMRDVLIGHTPPTAFTDLIFLIAATAMALVIFVKHPGNRLTRWPLLLTDAVGLGLFCVTGTVVAYDAGLGAPTSALLGVTTGIGGGVIRDVLSGQVPGVLRPDESLYAIPATLGAIVTAVLLHLGVYNAWAGLLCAALIIAFRLLALRYGWNGPRPHYVRRGDSA
ncbi:trimeric intracellular cation channel family protein [Gordonia sp. CPCC 205333]|uniref:trimeric intracellular cation channel family protein n=1 Tax=Gordonia sp. CPCC 205333 TaxID=3140790 RepID=UPI003AF39BB6